MRFDVKEHESRLTLQSRLSRQYHPVEITPWVTGREAYFISTTRRFLRRTGYICVKRRGGGYRTAVVPSVEAHSEASRVYMVFRLIRPELFKGGVAQKGDKVDGLDYEDEEDEITGPELPSIPLGGRLVTSAESPPILTQEMPGGQAHQIELRKVDSDV